MELKRVGSNTFGDVICNILNDVRNEDSLIEYGFSDVEEKLFKFGIRLDNYKEMVNIKTKYFKMIYYYLNYRVAPITNSEFKILYLFYKYV